jgi:type I restriction-modification system DNA methylase subunit
MATSLLDHYELIQQLTSEPVSPVENRRRLNDFAVELGWRPSDQLALRGAEEFTSGHLVVEHGLQNSAVISFLRRPVRYPDLNSYQQKILLNASYNNLIDWHIAVDYDGASFVYNRAAPPNFFSHRRQLSRERTSQLSSYEFDRVATDHPSPSVLALDTALIRTISLWKRQLSAEVRSAVNEEISALFNSVILVRALEDYHSQSTANAVLSLRQRCQEVGPVSLSRLLTEAVGALTNSKLPIELFDVSKVKNFDSLDSSTVREFIEDFYRNRYEPYFEYDFAVMSKHALSRIYEHYVSLLRYDEGGQRSFFPALPTEKMERSFGNVYTPEFIARFFAKYLRKELPLSKFQRLKTGDPACGSGIFLRTILETKFETLLDSFTTQSISEGFELVSGVDIDANACAAARLSLSLLSLVLTGAVPRSLDIIQADTLAAYRKNTLLRDSLDVVVSNPPFVSIDELPPERKRTLLEVLGGAARGKTDLYLGLLAVGLGMLKQGGFGLFVLPKNFLISDNAAPLRDELSRSSTLHCIVDLSAVRVFEEVGAYVVLVIFQKQIHPGTARPVLVVRCTDLVGAALEDALQDRAVRTPAYEVFWSAQPAKGEKSWEFATPESLALQAKLAYLPTLGEIAEIRQGLITGADDIFIVPGSAIPKGEKEIYVPFLSDREIEPYNLPRQPKRFVIYPFRGDEPLDGKDLQEEYPETWQYLLSHKKELVSRKSVKAGTNPWWRPIRTRQPRHLLRPKIVTPHLVISPRFALDPHGRYAVSHGPYVVLRKPGGIEELTCMLGILNSTPCFWLITQAAHKYSRGYSRLEVTTLARTPVPDFAKMERGLVKEIIRLVNKRMGSRGAAALEVESSIDERVADAYGFSEADGRLVGIGAFE